MNSENAEFETSNSILLFWATKVQILQANPTCTSPEEVLAQNLTQPCMTAYCLYHNIYDPGISPDSANQCILGVYLRSNLSRKSPGGREGTAWVTAFLGVGRAGRPARRSRRSSPARTRTPGVRRVPGARRTRPVVWGCKAFIQTTASRQDLEACSAHPWRTFVMRSAKAHDYLLCNMI